MNSRRLGRRILPFAAVLGFALAVSTPANALSSYTLTDLGMLGGPYGPFSSAYGINASGQVVGVSAGHAFITGANGVGMTDIGTLGAGWSEAHGINDAGQVVGFSTTASDGSYSHAFITGANGVGMTDIGTLGGRNRFAYGINSTGQVVGGSYLPGEAYSNAFITGANGVGMTNLGASFAQGINATGQAVGYNANNAHAFITGANGVGMTDIGTLGGGYSQAYSINASGQVVGDARTIYGNDHAFITGANGIGMTDIGTLGGNRSLALGINVSGQVVGRDRLTTSNWPWHAFITGANGVGMTDLNSLVTLAGDAYFSEATAINDLGQFVANASNNHAYLISAVPEPETYAMMLAGLGIMGFVARRKNRKSA